MNQGVRLPNGIAIQTRTARYRGVPPLGGGVNASTHLVVATSGPHKGIPFALKMFGRLAVPERREDFHREIEFLKSCAHPSVMRTFDEGVYYDKWPFVIAEYLPTTLEQI